MAAAVGVFTVNGGNLHWKILKLARCCITVISLARGGDDAGGLVCDAHGVPGPGACDVMAISNLDGVSSFQSHDGFKCSVVISTPEREIETVHPL